jgi:hypothetical protein
VHCCNSLVRPGFKDPGFLAKTTFPTKYLRCRLIGLDYAETSPVPDGTIEPILPSTEIIRLHYAMGVKSVLSLSS